MIPLRTILLLVLSFGTLAAETEIQRPNILFFLVDDMGWQDTSVPFHTQPTVNQTSGIRRTPNMERLARQGMKFTNAYAYSVCSPTRVSIMTGMSATRHHVTTWTHPASARHTGDNNVKTLRSPEDWRMGGIDETDITLPSLLREAGYRTIHAGKAHFGPNTTPSGDPRNIGFDVNIAGHGGGGPGSYYGMKNFGNGIWQVPGLEKYHGTDTFLTEALTLEMNQAIEEAVERKQPFFAYMSHYAVHVPWDMDKRFAANYPKLKGKALAYATQIEGMDKSLGDILAKIEALGEAENTLVIFYSDNGSDMANPVLRGKKGQFWEGGIRVPLLVAWAKPDLENVFQQRLKVPAGSVEEDIVTCEDMFPTLAVLSGINYSHQIDGHSLIPYLQGEAGTHRPQEFIQHFPHGHNHDHFALLRRGDWKLIHEYGSGQSKLYNLASDIGEKTDLAEQQSERVDSMRRYLRQRLEAMNAQYSVRVSDGSLVRP